MSTTAPLPPLSPNTWLRWDIIERQLPSDGIDAVEVGCGQGGIGSRLAERYHYLGLEPDTASSAVARERIEARGGEVRNGDRSVLRPDERFDLVVSFEVIEHIEDDTAELAAWAAILRPGGRVVLSTPAWQRRYGAADRLVGHHRRYDPDDLRRKMTAAGFVDVEIIHFGMPLGYALETARNLISARRLRHQSTTEARPTATNEERSQASGRMLQPSKRLTAALAEWGTWPFRRLQLLFPRTGPGIIATGRAPG